MLSVRPWSSVPHCTAVCNRLLSALHAWQARLQHWSLSLLFVCLQLVLLLVCLHHSSSLFVFLQHFDSLCLANIYNARGTCLQHSSRVNNTRHSLCHAPANHPCEAVCFFHLPPRTYTRGAHTHKYTRTHTHTHTHTWAYIQSLTQIYTLTPTHAYAIVNWGEFRRRRFEGDYADVGKEVQIAQFRKCA